ncbi:MAG: PAS domain S-box protein [Desulfohalobiaceae bacterium]
MNNKQKFWHINNSWVFQSQDIVHILDKAQIGIFKSTPEGTYIFANQALADMYGYATPQELLDSIQDIHTQVYAEPEKRKEFQRLLQEQGQVIHHEACLLRKDGSRIWVSRSAWAVRDNTGEISYYLGFSKDLSKHKKMQESLLKQKKIADSAIQQWQSTFDAIPDPIMLIDLEYRILRANQAMADKLHCTPEDLLGHNCFQVVHAGSDPPWFCPHRRSLENKSTERAEVTANRFGGVYDVSTTPIFDAEQNMQGSVHVARDITESKRAEKSLQESESLLHSITDAALDAILIMDEQGRISFWNPAAESIFGYTAQEVLGTDLHQKLAPQEYHGAFQQTFPEFQRSGKGPAVGHILELEALRKDGEQINISLSLSAFKKEAKWHALGIIRDITEQKKIQQELLQAKQDAEAANKAKSEFLANMSHEIRTPLNGIMGVMQLLQSSDLEAELREYVDIANNAADRLARLLSDILDLSMVEAGKLEFENQAFSLNALCEAVSNLFQLQARDKGLLLECFIDPCLPEKVLGDEKRVEQILFNLVGNALKYTPQGSVRLEIVPVAAENDQTFRLLFSVIDTGLGMAQDQLHKLFEPFVQADGSYTRNFQGAGLGLSIVYRLVDLMGGHISIESTPGEGTSVHVLLPFGLPEERDFQQLHSKTQKQGLNRSLRILIAEDEPSNQVFMQNLLHKLGHQVTLAANGQEVLDLLAEGDFDCILMDVQMPVLDGIKTTIRIRAAEAKRQESEVRGQESEIPGQGEEGVGSRTAEIGGQMSDLGSQSSGDKSDILDSTLPTSDVGPQTSGRIPIIALTAYAMSGDREKFLQADMDDYLAKPVKQNELLQALQRHLPESKY